MVESIIVLFFLCIVFFLVFDYARLLICHTTLDYAAARAARARAVGFNDFMCRKAARVAVIPVAGKRLWPEDDSFTYANELARVRTYLESPDGARAAGLLDYEHWKNLFVDPGDGLRSVVRLGTGWFSLEGKASVEGSASYYMEGGQ